MCEFASYPKYLVFCTPCHASQYIVIIISHMAYLFLCVCDYTSYFLSSVSSTHKQLNGRVELDRVEAVRVRENESKQTLIDVTNVIYLRDIIAYV